MKLADYLNALCDEHELTSISISHDRYGSGRGYHSYAHWKGELDHRCASAHAATPEEALAKAVAEANAIRGRGILVADALEVDQAA